MIPARVPLVPGRPFAGLVQAAGVHDLDEALELARLGFHSIGFPLRLPVHAPDLSETEAAVVIAALPERVTPVLITYEPDPAEILALCRALRVRHVQFHADPEPARSVEILSQLRQADPGLFLIKSLVVGREHESVLLAKIARLTPLVDAFIADSHDPTSGADGATGLTHDWQLSRRLIWASPKPVILAGGLTPDNVRQAVKTVRPAGVDAHTGLEGPDGRKDPELCRAFLADALAAMAGPGSGS